MIYVACLENSAEDVVLQGNSPICSLEELYQLIPDKSARDLEITQEFLQTYMTIQGALELKEQIGGMNPNLNVILPEACTNYFAPNVEALGKIRDVSSLIRYFVQGGNQAMELLKHLCEHYTTINNEALAYSSQIATLQMEKEQVKQELRESDEIRALQVKTIEDLQYKLETLTSRIRYQHNLKFDLNSMLEVNTLNSTYRKILYIKEVTRVRFVDTFLYYLREILKSLSGVASRFVVIETPQGYHKSAMYPDCADKMALTNQDVATGDIFMAGFDEKLMQLIINNPSRAPYLIVLDRSGCELPYLKGHLVNVLYTASDPQDIDQRIPARGMITYREATLNIPFIPNFDTLTPDERLKRYSSMDIVTACVKLLEGEV